MFHGVFAVVKGEMRFALVSRHLVVILLYILITFASVASRRRKSSSLNNCYNHFRTQISCFYRHLPLLLHLNLRVVRFFGRDFGDRIGYFLATNFKFLLYGCNHLHSIWSCFVYFISRLVLYITNVG